MSLKTKDPGDKEIYGYVFEDWLEGDTIQTSTWDVLPSAVGITVTNPTHSDTVTAITVDGGTDGGTYRLKNTIVATPSTRKKVKSFILIIKED